MNKNKKIRGFATENRVQFIFELTRSYLRNFIMENSYNVAKVSLLKSEVVQGQSQECNNGDSSS